MRRLLLVLLAVVVFASVPATLANAPEPPSVLLSGYVRDIVTGAPIIGARVVVDSVTIMVEPDGSIPSTSIPLKGPVDKVAGSVTAVGYDLWSFQGVNLRAGQPVELHVKLRRGGALIQPIDFQQALASQQNPAATPAYAGLPPEYVDVGITGVVDCKASRIAPFHVERMRFVDYVRNVLPNEWVSGWPPASLDAGAIAVKEYAWYTAVVERKWRTWGYPFDLIDSTCDQVYKKDSAVADTDAAVARTWLARMLLDDRLIPTFYRNTVDNCPIFPGCMGQDESAQLARDGQTAEQILSYFYDPAQYNILALTPRIYLPLVTR